MKIRDGFVSNSSSSSFVLDRSKLTRLQIAQIQDHIEVAQELNLPMDSYENDAWSVSFGKKNGKKTIDLHTWMDNFDMRYFLSQIGVPDDAIIDNWCS